MSKKIFKLSLVLVVLAIVVSGCTLPWKKKAVVDNTNQVNPDGSLTEEIATSTKKIKKFENYEELKKFLEEHNNSDLQSFNGDMRESVASNLTRQGLAVKTEASFSAESGTAGISTNPAVDESVASADYSSTNNQVAGVDEADIIKTDGNYIYALVRNELKIIKANPAAEATVVSTITFKSRPQDIFINGSNLAVFGSDQQIYTLEAYKSWRRQSPYVFFKVFDLVNPAEPKLVRDLKFEGSYTDARSIGDYVYLFTNSQSNYIVGEPVLPRVLDNDLVLSDNCDFNDKCFAPDVYYFDIPYDSSNFSSITAINVKDNKEAINGQTYLMSYGQNFYVSQKNIYITYTEYLNEYELEQTVTKKLIFPKLSSEEQNKIKQIETVADYILSKNEKLVKIYAIIGRYLSNLSDEDQAIIQTEIDTSLKQELTERASEMEKTVIHKIAINGRQVEYKGMGEVSGQVLNQFSLDENGDYLRLATTRSQIWSRLTEKPNESYSNVYVLDNELKIVGRLENLATTEQIYAARFMGDRVYLVTFKKTDPLYAISLSDPTKPSVLGAIKIPGYSTYLHPVDKNGNKLIGLGRDAEENSDGSVKVKGLKLALFDFTDLNQPKELDSYLIGDSSSDSIALQDHKAFLYSEEKNLLAIPAVLRENNKLTFAGTLVFNIVNNKFALKGKIDHSEGGNFSSADYWDGYGYYDNSVKRSLYIKESLYTFSNKFLKINNLNDLSTIKNIILTSGGDDYIITSPSTPLPAVDTPVADKPLIPVTPPAAGSSSAGTGSATGSSGAGSTEIAPAPLAPVLPTATSSQPI